MRVYVIRHGESEANLSKVFTGWMDAPLTEKGREEAKLAGTYLRIAFDKIYASDLWRAMETAETALPGCVYEKSALAREISVGTLMGKPLSTLTPEQMEQTVTEGYAPYGGEAKAERYGRIRQLMKQLEGSGCETVAVFAHGGWLRAMLEPSLAHICPEKMSAAVCSGRIFPSCRKYAQF